MIVGKTDYFFEVVIQYAQKLGLEGRVVFPGYVPDEQLIRLYQDCYAYIFPSLYEGFGLPPLEAMAMGAPILLSSATCLPEIFGPDIPYFDPNDTQDISKIMKQAVLDAKFPTSQVAVAQTLLSTYSWQKMAEETKKLYNRFSR